ncbi:hypothetical protein TDMWS_03520 [Thermodesulfomicrobium sp. WS]|nr:hypothetical protein TDMWS_03520 [Thermodesulfomicrobium sp. WS]
MPRQVHAAYSMGEFHAQKEDVIGHVREQSHGLEGGHRLAQDENFLHRIKEFPEVAAQLGIGMDDEGFEVAHGVRVLGTVDTLCYPQWPESSRGQCMDNQTGML